MTVSSLRARLDRVAARTYMPAYFCSLVRRDFGTQMRALFGPRATREMMSHGHKDNNALGETYSGTLQRWDVARYQAGEVEPASIRSPEELRRYVRAAPSRRCAAC